MKIISGRGVCLASPLGRAKGVDDTHIVQIIAVCQTLPLSFRDQFSNWSWESVLIGTVYSFSAAYGDANCHVARPSLLAMTGQFSRAPISLPLSAAPLRGSPQCAHWGKGSPGSDTVQMGKDRTQCGLFFSLLAVSQPRRPLSLAIARQLP